MTSSKPTDRSVEQTQSNTNDHTSKLQADAQLTQGQSIKPATDTSRVPPLEIVDSRESAKPGDLRYQTNEAGLQKSVQDLLRRSKAGEKVTFEIASDTEVKSADGKIVKGGQPHILYEELKKAYPDRHFVFAKPELRLTDANYESSKIHTPVVDRDGMRLSSSENQITTSREVTLPNGTKLPAGSKFSNGTIFDGTSVRSADPSSKVWATTSSGETVAVTETGKSVALSGQDIVSTEKGMGQPLNKSDRLIVRTGKDKMPDGKSVLDVYPNTEKSFHENYTPTETPGVSVPKAKSAEHFKLPANITVEAMLPPHGHSTAEGAKEAFLMKRGWANQKEAAAKNYTGVTDARSAQEMVKIRKEVGMTGETQVEEGLKKFKERFARWEQRQNDNKWGWPGNEVTRDTSKEVEHERKERTKAAEPVEKAPETKKADAEKAKPTEQRSYKGYVAKGFALGVLVSGALTLGRSLIKQHPTSKPSEFKLKPIESVH